MMIVKVIKHPVAYLGVSYVNEPQKMGEMASVPALYPTTLFEVICQVPLDNLGSAETAQSSPAKAHRGGQPRVPGCSGVPGVQT